MRETIRESHPASATADNEEFNLWFENGWVECSNLAPHADSMNDVLAILRKYVVGFRDGHLALSITNIDRGWSWMGFSTAKFGNKYVVAKHTEESWPIDLPPVGAEIVNIGGIEIEDYLKRYISPFVDARVDLASTWYRLAEYVSASPFAQPILRHPFPQKYVIKDASGKFTQYPAVWRKHFPLKVAARAKSNSVRLCSNGVYWVNAVNFQPANSMAGEFEEFISILSKINDAKTLIFDLRGNNGGSSWYGLAIFEALGLPIPDSEASSTVAEWRVSPLLETTLRRTLSDFNRIGESGSQYMLVNDLLSKVIQAQATGLEWIVQPNFEDETQSGFRERNQNANLVLITDAWCASAGLDFCDLIYATNRYIHVGLPTGADSIYMDIGVVEILKGVSLACPLKMWKNRTRKNNQPYSPSIVFQDDINDDLKVKEWMLNI